MTSEGSMGKLRAQDGFSLIELIVVVSIAAVVMAVLTPGIRRSSDIFTLRRAASLAMVELRTAQAIATNNGVDVVFEFYTTTGSGGPGGVRYWARPFGGGSWSEVRSVVTPEWPSIIQMREGSGLPMCAAPADVTHTCLIFKPLGDVDTNPTPGPIRVPVRVRAAGTFEWDIEINRATGRARVVQ